MKEMWAQIPDFPDYVVSNFGEVKNINTERILKVSTNRGGVTKVGLVNARGQSSRSVKLLVAEQFVFGRTDIFDTPIQLDNDPSNNRADNLMWRPRWFSWHYIRQFKNDRLCNTGPVWDSATGLKYEDLSHAAEINGVLMEDIMKSIRNPKCPVFPTNQVYRFKE